MAACRAGSKLRVFALEDARRRLLPVPDHPSRFCCLHAGMQYVMWIAEKTVVDDCVRRPEDGPVRWYSVVFPPLILRPTRCKWNVTCACYSCWFMWRRCTWRSSNMAKMHHAQQVLRQLNELSLSLAAMQVGLTPISIISSTCSKLLLHQTSITRLHLNHLTELHHVSSTLSTTLKLLKIKKP